MKAIPTILTTAFSRFVPRRPRAECLVILAQVFLSSVSWGFLWSMPSFDELLQSNVVIVVKQADIKAEDTHGVIDDNGRSFVEISSFDVIKGDLPVEKLKIQMQVASLPLAPAYLVFLTRHQEQVWLTNNGCSYLPMGSTTCVDKNAFDDKKSATKTLCKLLASETDKTCALAQSYFLSDGDPAELTAAWEELKKRADEQSYDMQLAIANVGLRVIGLKALDLIKTSPSLPTIETPTINKTQEEYAISFYRDQVQGCMRKWVKQNAPQSNADEILDTKIKPFRIPSSL